MMDTFDKYGTNFDDLALKFEKKVYGGIKGKIRLKVIEKDLRQFVPQVFQTAGSSPLRIMDAGCGSAPVSINFAQSGHRVTLCDISARMLGIARKQINEKGVSDKIHCIHAPIQELSKSHFQAYDLILCHAVLEWVDNAEELIAHFTGLMNKNGLLSLTFYNIHGMIFKNLLRTNYKKIQKKAYAGWAGSLTPKFPREAGQMKKLLNANGMEILSHSGIRVFHDYILNPDDQKKDPDAVLAIEIEFSKRLPYRDMGRYQHLICQKKQQE